MVVRTSVPTPARMGIDGDQAAGPVIGAGLAVDHDVLVIIACPQAERLDGIRGPIAAADPDQQVRHDRLAGGQMVGEGGGTCLHRITSMSAGC
ncbi:hypothetical protein [Paracoccus contaminans]|uniref:hypothetical protein n=1 Tax=Paracoccus contaminans TaxID=1945662 RepID=UPI0012F4A1DD|nr:hypothetical protein [Paracoccus contaminans]